MGWHMEGDPTTPNPLNFVDPVCCFYCSELIAPTEAYCYWGGGTFATEAENPENFDVNNRETWPKLIIAEGHLYLHPGCAITLCQTLTKDALMAEHYGRHPLVGQVGRTEPL